MFGTSIQRAPVRMGAMAAAVAVTVGLAACGSSSSSSSTTAASSSGAAPTTSAATNPKGTPITIGFGVSETGALASSDVNAAPAAEAWEQSVNAAGGINGHPLNIIIGDTQGSAAAASALMQKFVTQDHVSAVMISDPVAEGAVGSYLAAHKIPVFGASGFLATEWNGLPNFYADSQNSDEITASEAVAAVSAGYKNVAVAACNATSTCAGDGPPIEAAVKAAGGTYTGLAGVAVGAPSYTAQCLDFEKAKTDAIVLVIDPATSVQLMQSCIQQGYKGVFTTASTSFNTVSLKAINGAKIVGSLASFPWWVSSPAVDAYRKAIATYEPKMVETSEATAVWSSLQLFKKVVSGISGAITPASVTSGYDSVKKETLGGLLPQPLTYTAGKAAPEVDCFWQFKYTTGGDASPTLVAPTGAVGNGGNGPLATACSK